MEVSRLQQIQDGHAATASGVFELATYFEMIFVEIHITKCVEGRFSHI